MAAKDAGHGGVTKLGVDPRRYLRAALARILAGHKDLAALLPERYVMSSSATAQDLAA